MPQPTPEQRAKACNRDRGAVRRQYHVGGVEVRKPDEGTVTDFYGHASVTGTGYEMYGGPEKGGWTEYVDPGAFKRTLGRKPDVVFLVNHGGISLARTTVKDGAGSLKLAEDEVGLEVRAGLDTRVSVANDLVTLMDLGVIDEMSFAFRVTDQVWMNADGDEVPWWDLDGIERHIRAVDIDHGDVSAVNYGANPFTDAALRSAMATGGIVTGGSPLTYSNPEHIAVDATRHVWANWSGTGTTPQFIPATLNTGSLTYTITAKDDATAAFRDLADHLDEETETGDPEVVPVHPDHAERILAARRRENAWRADPARPL